MSADGGAWPWILLALLGAYHGINPAMGWLFAVGLGLQDRSRRSVLRALPPIAVGHELSLAVVLLLVVVLGVFADADTLRAGAAVVLIAFGIFRLWRPRAHPRWTRFRVTRPELAWWSFLMSSAHGAGLMIAPVVLGLSAGGGGGDDHVKELGLASMSLGEGALALVVHVGAMVLVMGVIAVVVYEKLGLRVLRRAWVNLDAVWAGAFILAGLWTLVS